MRRGLFLTTFLFLCIATLVSVSAETSGEKAAARFIPELRTQLKELGSRAEVLSLELTYEAGQRDLIRGGQMRLTAWNLKAKINGQNFEVLNLNILVTDEDGKGRDRTVERLAAEIAKRAIEVSRIGK